MLRVIEKTQPPEEEQPTGKSYEPSDGSLHWIEPGNKIHFISLGCPRNLVDSEVMLGILLRAGYEATEDVTQSDYIVINTCGFLEASRNESMQTIRETLDTRKKGAKLIVTGCMVQTHSPELIERFPKVDYYLGSGDVEKILDAVRATEKGSQITSARSYLEAGEVPRQLSTPKHFAYLKIAEGCRKKCAYCIIPNIKGPLKSKGKEQILKEFQLLLNQGVQEIILIAQDLGDYGKDQGFKRSEGLVDLLKTMLENKGDFWLRLLYLYPDEITDDLIELMKSDARICRYVDIPIQHINNRVLKSMHRATSKEQIISIIGKLRKEIPDIVIRTSLIVGFPGETEEEFKELIGFVEQYELDNVGIFKYSREKGSHADTMDGHHPDNVKNKRYHTLMKAQKKVMKRVLARNVGKTISVVVEGYHPESKFLMLGRHGGQCPDIDGNVIINDTRNVKAFGQRYSVKITGHTDYDLIGTAM